MWRTKMMTVTASNNGTQMNDGNKTYSQSGGFTIANEKIPFYRVLFYLFFFFFSERSMLLLFALFLSPRVE